MSSTARRGVRRRSPRSGLATAREAAARVAARCGIAAHRQSDAGTVARRGGGAQPLRDRRADAGGISKPAICAVPARFRAANWCRKPTRISRPGARRIVLVDDNGVRATMTASWLKQMGWQDVAVFVAGPADGDWETGPQCATRSWSRRRLDRRISTRWRCATIVRGQRDGDRSRFQPALRQGHIPGAWFAIRSRLADAVAKLPASDTIVLTSPTAGWPDWRRLSCPRLVRPR